MKTIPAALYSFLYQVLVRQEGQDLVEYSLVFSLVAFGAITGMGNLASGVSDVFSSVTVSLTTNV
jgi:Flp pilus assembly pilin Flp